LERDRINRCFAVWRSANLAEKLGRRQFSSHVRAECKGRPKITAKARHSRC
jgi:hypothetical protein